MSLNPPLNKLTPDARRFILFLLLVLTSTSVFAKNKHRHKADYQDYVIVESQHEVLHLSADPTRIAIGDPEIADVTLTNTPRELLIVGKKPGTTNLHVWLSDHSSPQRYRLRIDPATTEGEFSSLLEHAGKIQEPQPDPRDLSSVDVAGTQIQADIKIVEISRSALKEAGFFFHKNFKNTVVSVAPPGTLSGVDTSDAGSLLLKSASGFFPYAQAFQMVFGDSRESWLSTVSLLEQGGYAYVLAEPSLVVMAGQTANFLAGGEFPIPVAQGSGASGAITVKYREFGIRLALTPTILDSERIVMKVAPEVSDLDFSVGVQSAGTQVPALKVRRTDTTIELGDGESFVISGLISQNTVANEDKLPWLGDLPYIGAFFRSKSFEKQDKELLMVVTPHIVHPIGKHVPLPQLPGENYRTENPTFNRFLFHTQQPKRGLPGSMEGFSR